MVIEMRVCLFIKKKPNIPPVGNYQEDQSLKIKFGREKVKEQSVAQKRAR